MKNYVITLVITLSVLVHAYGYSYHKSTAPQDSISTEMCKQFAHILSGKVLPRTLTKGVCVVARPRNVAVTLYDSATKSPLVGTPLISLEKTNKGYLVLAEFGTNDPEARGLRDSLTKAHIKNAAMHNHWLNTTVNGKPAEIIYSHWYALGNDPQVIANVLSAAWAKNLKDRPPASTSAKLPDFCAAFAKQLGGDLLPGDLTRGVCTVAKAREVPVKILGAATKSPLVTTAMFSSEQTPKGTYINIGQAGGSDAEMRKLIAELARYGIHTTAINTHWLATDVKGKPETLVYVHWVDPTSTPQVFAQKVSKSLNASLEK